MTTSIDDIPLADQAPTQLNPSSPPHPPVKSNAVVKYSAVTFPPTYAKLNSNTDIKLPPSNWLSSYADSFGLNYSLPRTTGFTSFRMANMFPDCVGEVDVVSDAENIKKLLKIPYSDNTVSMMVHRVENTLLIDEFDIHKHLLSRSESDWAWLRKFFVEHIIETLSNKDKTVSIRDKSRYALQQKSLVSKFLHYSLAETEKDDETSESNTNTLPLPITRGPALPEPLLEEGLPDSTNNHKFTRNVVWTFEDIQMLLGTDMPIFGGQSRPCISLRLRDATKPISVLTGIDYWLDNLMSNVPEVVMCYHLDGIVQKYELVKTEDLPYLKESKFSPNLIRDVAQNILSFLKSNATKAGHTYWLFKGTNDDAVKLYDLTSLCSESLEEKDQNPFTVPVGMLLYRVARNMKASGDLGQLATIRILLKNCLSLLSKEKYPQIVTSAHFMLSDVYVPGETDPSAPELLILPHSSSDQIPTKETEEEEVEDISGITSSVHVTELCISNYSNTDNKYQPPPMISGLEERCNLALHHVSEGLDCLQYFDKKDFLNKEKSKIDEDEPRMAKQSEAIPMPYSKLDQNKAKIKSKKNAEKECESDNEGNEDNEDKSLKALLCHSVRETLPTWQKPEKIDSNSWKKHLGSLLTRKACLVYSILIEREMNVGNYALALRHIQGVLRCCDENKGLVGLMLNRAGDCLLNFSDLTKANIETDRYPVVERPGQSLYEKELELIPNSFEDPEVVLVACVKCYTRSLELSHSIDTLRKTGNACNLVNSLFNNWAAGLLHNREGEFDEAKFNKYVKEAERYLELGLKSFEAVDDVANCALLMCNLGRLNRLKAHNPKIGESSYMSPQQKHYYSMALDCYGKALNYLGNKKVNTNVWEAINWELSSTLFTYATYMQDNPPPIADKKCGDVEREVIDLLQKALKHCDLTTNSPNQPLYQYRAAKLHHRLASLYYNSFRYYNKDSSKKRAALLRLLEIHYANASSLFATLENPADMLRVQLERISLEEYLADETKSARMKKKHYQAALELAVKCKDALTIIQEREAAIANKSGNQTEQEKEFERAECGDKEEEQSLLKLLLERIQFLLKTLVKLIASEKQSTNLDKYKKVYGASLKYNSAIEIISHLSKIMELIEKEDLTS